LNGHLLLHESLWAVAPAADGLSPKQPVAFSTAADHPLVLPTSGHALRMLIDDAAARTGAEMTISVQTNSMQVQKQLVLAGHGWTILPGVGVADDVAKGVLSAAPLCEPDVTRAIVVAAPRTTRIPPAMEAVARELIRQVLAAVADGRWPIDESQPVTPPLAPLDAGALGLSSPGPRAF
ncbi:MAG TPA: LysR substrate-binding domain-containing protein, partial [Yinghuangia sp.]|nr:LysR substrate-binding domain-containing protein [Yinghuangia sp.]